MDGWVWVDGVVCAGWDGWVWVDGVVWVGWVGLG